MCIDLSNIQEKIREHIAFAVVKSYRQSEIKLKLEKQLKQMKTNSLKKQSLSALYR